YEQKTFLREKGLAPAAMKEIHPLGKAPMIKDGEQVIIESGAIVEYIIDRYGNGKLAASVDSPDYGRYLQWLHYAEGSAMADMLGELRVRRVLGDKTADSKVLQDIAARTEAMRQYVDSELALHPFLAGSHFTAADIMMEFNFAFMARMPKISLAGYPHIVAWLQRVRGRPAYQRMIAVAAPQVPLPG
ncbi:MAG: glutathione S-transferase family protein, partial [Spongiibacteraceae bacterium]